MNRFQCKAISFWQPLELNHCRPIQTLGSRVLSGCRLLFMFHWSETIAREQLQLCDFVFQGTILQIWRSWYASNKQKTAIYKSWLLRSWDFRHPRYIITGQTTNWNFMTKLSFRQSRKSSRTRKIHCKVPLDQMNAPSESLRSRPGNKTFVPSISASLKYECYILFRHYSV